MTLKLPVPFTPLNISGAFNRGRAFLIIPQKSGIEFFSNVYDENLYLILSILLVFVFVFSQNAITVTFPGLAIQQIKLLGFEGFDTYTIDSVQANKTGEFNLSYCKQDYGMA